MIAVKHQPAHPRGARPMTADTLAGALRCRRKFRRFFPEGFLDQTYLDWERDYKVEAHEQWLNVLDRPKLAALIKSRKYDEIAAAAVRVESRVRHSMLFSFEKMALRDAVRSPGGAKTFAQGLWNFLHGHGTLQRRFEAWVDAIASLPRRQTRVLTWPMVSVWGILADPKTHIFVKPNTTRAAAEAYGFALPYRSRPNWQTYAAVLEFAGIIRRDLSAVGREMRPRDMIDLQSFMWVQGSDEYEE